MGKSWLPLTTYKTILKNSPLSTADLVVTRQVSGKTEFLLGRRTDRPAKGQWFIFGGKQLKGERMEKAAARNLRRELGVQALRMRAVGHQDFQGINNIGIRYHSVMHIYVAEIPTRAELKPNKEHSSLKWFRTINSSWPTAVQKALKKSGFRHERTRHAQ